MTRTFRFGTQARARLHATGLGCATAAGLLLGHSPAMAQQPPDTSRRASDVIEEVLVTARRREEGLYETPMAISAFTEEMMALQGIDQVEDIGRSVPNLNITRFGVGNPSHAAIFIRGIGLQDHIITTDPGVGVYVDGIYLGRQMGANLNLKNVERVEVLRGPQGTLYGRNTIGGAVNIITKKPGEEVEFQYDLQAGSRGRLGGSFYSSQKFGDAVGFSAAAAITRRDGIGEALLVEDEAHEVGELFEASFRSALNWQASDDFSLLFALDAVQGENGQSPAYIELMPGGGFFTDPNNVSGLPPPNNVPLTPDDLPSDPDDTNTAEAGLLTQRNSGYGLSATADWNIDSNLGAKALLGYRYSDYKGGLDDEDAFQDFQSFPEEGEAEQVSVELSLSGEYGDFDFVSGLFYFTEDGNTFSGPNTFITHGDIFDINQDTTSYAAYVHGGYQISGPLKIAGGVRFTKDEKEADALFTNFPWFLAPPQGNGDGNPGSAQREFREDDWDDFTWDLSLTYSVSEDVSAYFSTARGYQSGGYPARAFGGPATFTAFDPITAQNYEIGVKGLITPNWQLAASVFFTQYDDLALQFSETFAGGFITITSNAGESEAKGVEVESLLRLGDSFTLTTNIGYIDAEITRVDAGTVGIVEGDSPTLTPELTALIGVEYDQNLASGSRVIYRADYSFRDEMFGQSINNEFNRIDSRELVNFVISYEHGDGDWSLGLYGDNVFNEKYDIARLDLAFSGFTEIIRSNDRSEFGIKFSQRIR